MRAEFPLSLPCAEADVFPRDGFDSPLPGAPGADLASILSDFSFQRTLRVVAVDDEALALKRLDLLLRRIPSVELVGTAASAEAAMALVDTVGPDVLLVDINMPGTTGLELAQRLGRSQAPIVIFVTAFDRFAATAFDMGAVDYVLKPIELGRLQGAIERARRSLAALDADDRINELHQVVAALRTEAAVIEAKRYETEIWAERRNEFFRIRVEELEWVAAERDYVRLHAHGQSYLLRDTLSSVQARLDPNAYVRIRRSALVRIDRVTGIRKVGYGHFRVTLTDGSSIRVGRTYVGQIRRRIAPRASV